MPEKEHSEQHVRALVDRLLLVDPTSLGRLYDSKTIYEKRKPTIVDVKQLQVSTTRSTQKWTARFAFNIQGLQTHNISVSQKLHSSPRFSRWSPETAIGPFITFDNWRTWAALQFMTFVPVTSFDNLETFVVIVGCPTSERTGIGILFPKSDQQLEETMEKWLQRMDRIQFREKRDPWLHSDRLSAPLKNGKSVSVILNKGA
jgi:hypothetical protein